MKKRSQSIIWKTSFFALLAAMAVVFPNTACAADTPGVTGDRILLGHSTVLSGMTSSNANLARSGANLLFDEINKNGGVFGRKIKVIFYDDGYEPKAAMENLKRLINDDKVFAIFQNYGSESAVEAIPLIEKFDIPFIAPIASAEKKLRTPVNRNIFTVRSSAAADVTEIIRFAVSKLGLKEFGIAYQTDAMGAAVQESFAAALKSESLKPAFEGKLPRNSDAVSETAEALLKSRPKVVVLGAQAQVSCSLIKHLSAKGYQPIYLGFSLHTTPEFQSCVAAAAKLAHAAHPLQPLQFYVATGMPLLHSLASASLPIVQKFTKAAKAANVPLELISLEGYINATVLVESLHRAGKNLTRDSLRSALENLGELDLGGVVVKYTKESHRGMSKVFIGALKDGGFHPIDVTLP